MDAQFSVMQHHKGAVVAHMRTFFKLIFPLGDMNESDYTCLFYRKDSSVAKFNRRLHEIWPNKKIMWRLFETHNFPHRGVYF